MKHIMLFTTVILSVTIAFASVSDSSAKSKYKVTIFNLTKGQPLTPAAIVSHKQGFQVFTLGEKASDGLQLQAKDGATNILVEELDGEQKVTSVATAQGVLLPGQSTVVELEANAKDKVSITSMLARTNDAIVALRGAYLPRYKGEKQSYLLRVYDAGAEANTESCAHIPAPPCNSHNAETDTNEGFVHLHPGIQNIGDLDPLRDAFGVIGAKVVIEKI